MNKMRKRLLITAGITLFFVFFVLYLAGTVPDSSTNAEYVRSSTRVWALYCFIGGLIASGIIIAIQKSEDKQQNKVDSYVDSLVDIWKKRAQQLNVDTSSPIIWQASANGANLFYAVHIWREGDYLCRFLGKPTQQTMKYDGYRYPERLTVDKDRISRFYRSGSQGVRYERDFSEADAKLQLSKYQSGLQSVATSLSALQAAQLAPTKKIEYDTRRTIIEYKDGSVEYYRIDAFDTLLRLFPNPDNASETVANYNSSPKRKSINTMSSSNDEHTENAPADMKWEIIDGNFTNCPNCGRYMSLDFIKARGVCQQCNFPYYTENSSSPEKHSENGKPTTKKKIWIRDEDGFTKCPNCDAYMSFDYILTKRKCPKCGQEYA